MLVDQALFTSAQTRRVCGYHLVAQSAGIDERTCRELTRWCPSHGGMIGTDADSESVNYFLLGGGRVCLSRTVYGGLEYSRRGGWKVVTRMLVLTARQLRGYGNHPLHLARTALALGHLRLEAAVPAVLPEIELPDGTAAALSEPAARERTEMLAGIAEELSRGERLAVLGADDPLSILEMVLACVSPAERPQVSFTTGLRPSVHREFRLHVLPAETDAVPRQQLAAMGIRVLTLQSGDVPVLGCAGRPRGTATDHDASRPDAPPQAPLRTSATAEPPF